MKSIRKIFISPLFTVFASSVLLAEKPLAPKKLIQALIVEVSGEIAFNYTVLISHFDRIQASEGWHDAAYEALNFADGKRSIFDIAKAVSAEYGPVNIMSVHDFFIVLEKAGLVKLKNI